MNRKQYVGVVVLALLSIMFLESFLAIGHKNLTFDDPTSISIGYYYLTTHDPRMLVIHPPLAYMVGAFPLLFTEINYPYSFAGCKDYFPYACSNEFIFNSSNDIGKISFLSRMPFIFVSIVMGLFTFLLARKIYGEKAGIFSLLLYVFSPNVLGFSTMVFTDFVVALFILLTIFFLRESLIKMSLANIFLTGLFLGLALTSKFISLFLLPVILILMGLRLHQKFKAENIVQRKSRVRLYKKYLLIFFIISIVAFSVMNVVYFFQFDTISNSVPERFTERGFKQLGQNYPEGTFLNELGHFVIEKIKFPLPSYLGGISAQIFVGSSPLKRSYLNGELFGGGKWYYFFEELAIRLPIPLIIFFLASFLFYGKLRSKNIMNEFVVLIPLVVFFIIYLPGSFSYHFRYLIPIFPFIFILSGRVVNLKFKRKGVFYFILGTLTLWYVLSSLLIFPHYMSYFNEFIGGPDKGHKFILDYDLGQDLMLLGMYVEENDIDNIQLSYHGTFDPGYYGIKFEQLPMEFYIPWVQGYAKQFEELQNYTEDCSEKTGLVAISLANYHNVHLINKSCFNWLYEHEPVERVGYTIFVFNITG
jgi:hypothetical protein